MAIFCFYLLAFIGSVGSKCQLLSNSMSALVISKALIDHTKYVINTSPENGPIVTPAYVSRFELIVKLAS